MFFRNAGASDQQQLAYALSQQRVIFTFDDDFLSLASTGIEHGIALRAMVRTFLNPETLSLLTVPRSGVPCSLKRSAIVLFIIPEKTNWTPSGNR